jgi:hypothetical protein
MVAMTGFTPRDVEVATSILTWARDVLAVENPEVGRPHGNQVVCPFVAGSIEADALRLYFHNEVNGFSEEQVESVLLSYIPLFRTIPPFDDAHRINKALLVVFPNIDKRHLGVLDISHSLLKSKFVGAGLMIGQFHPQCKEEGIWNPKFRPSISPYPLMAIRHMALHDIIFLRNSADWFAAYNVRFGDRFKPSQLDQDARPFADLYYRALGQYRT